MVSQSMIALTIFGSPKCAGLPFPSAQDLPKMMRYFLIVTQVPVYCWNCIVDSPAETDLYKYYQKCLIENWSQRLMGIGILVLLIILLVIV